MLVWVPPMNLPLIRLPFFNSKESALAANAATHRATITPQICLAFITSSPAYSLCYVALRSGQPGLTNPHGFFSACRTHCLIAGLNVPTTVSHSFICRVPEESPSAVFALLY